MMRDLLDTTILSNFAHVRRAELLRSALGTDAGTTPRVLAELRAGESQGLVPACDWSWLEVLTPDTGEERLAGELARQLDPGEAECLAVAISRGCRVLSDDFAARRLGEGKGLAVSGTLGVLVRLCEMRLLSPGEADELLTQMIGHGYRSPMRSVKGLLLR
jgi:predicted nucleic acid-binding protein